MTASVALIGAGVMGGADNAALMKYFEGPASGDAV